jgi:hypothetical protein
VSVEDHIATLAFGLPTEVDAAEGKLRAVWPTQVRTCTCRELYCILTTFR